VIHASEELRSKPFSFFIKTYLITAGAWMARFSVLVFLIFAFIDLKDIVHNPNNPLQGANEFIQTVFLYVRQAVLYVIMEVSPSPGGAGLADDAFRKFTIDLLPLKIGGFTVVIGLLWRILTYYVFLIVGAVVVPNWINNVIKRRRKERG
jgi:glycosyltransferase 2 family protein